MEQGEKGSTIQEYVMVRLVLKKRETLRIPTKCR